MISKTFESLFINFHHKLVKFVQRTLPRDSSEAEDIVQKAYLRVLEKPDGLNDKEKIYPYVRKAAYNLAINHVLRNRCHVNIDLLPEDCLETPLEEDFSDLRDQVEDLPDTCREVVNRVYLQGEKRREVAQELGVHQDTVKYRLGQGLTLLRRRIK